MGRKTHMLKLLVGENTQARASLLSLAEDLKKVGLILEKLTSEGLQVGDKVAKIDKISIPTLTSILKDCGYQISKGRPKDSRPIWVSVPQAVSAIESLIESVGIDAAVEHLNNEGISFGTTKITFNGENTLTVSSLSKVLGKKIAQNEPEDPAVLVAKSIDEEYDLEDEDEDEDEEDEEDEEDDEDEEDEEDDEDEDEDEFLGDEADDYEEDEDEEEDEEEDEDYDDEVSDF